uniref:Aspartate aminotransferase n=1 Tax=Globodera rostochiensis TaxID=31243 RepID=A0A914HSH2_GLORO
MTAFFANITEAPPIEVFQMNKLYMDDPSEQKVNLTIGAYRTADGKPWVLPVVREVERHIVADESLNHEYLPVLGFEPFCAAATELVLGQGLTAVKEGKVFGIQCLSGTGSLRVGAELLCRIMGHTTVYISKPSWGNHRLVFSRAGFVNVVEYRYWDSVGRKIDFSGLLEDLEAAPERSVIVLHGCAHNPTGMDPTQEQWQQIAELIKRKNLFTFFDVAYQGFASGDPDADAWSIRHFVDKGMEMLVAQSFAKNFGLYNERVGNLTVVVSEKSVVPALRSQISLIIRANWSNPPSFGARIVHLVLTTPELRSQWLQAIKTMSSRIRQMRASLREALERLQTPGSWEHVTSQIGMFSYTGLDKDQVNHLIGKHKVYLLSDGRISICGLNGSNVDYVAKAIDDAVRNAVTKNAHHI